MSNLLKPGSIPLIGDVDSALARSYSSRQAVESYHMFASEYVNFRDKRDRKLRDASGLAGSAATRALMSPGWLTHKLRIRRTTQVTLEHLFNTRDGTLEDLMLAEVVPEVHSMVPFPDISELKTDEEGREIFRAVTSYVEEQSRNELLFDPTVEALRFLHAQRVGHIIGYESSLEGIDDNFTDAMMYRIANNYYLDEAPLHGIIPVRGVLQAA